MRLIANLDLTRMTLTQQCSWILS